MTEKERERRRKLSDAMKRNFLEQVEVGPYEPPPEKPCSRCKKVKSVEEFHLRRYKLKSGLVKVTPESQCKECMREKERVRTKKRKEDGTYKALRERCEASRDKENQREYQRIYATLQRRKKGMKVRGPWLKYRDSAKGGELPAEPFAAFIKEEARMHGYKGLARELDRDEKRVRVWAKAGHPQIALQTVDYVLTKLGKPDLLHELYPLEETTFGYFKDV